MLEDPETKPYDMEERTFQYARRVRMFVKRLPQTVCNREDVPQLVKASGSVGANYIEANESLGKKDFLMRLKISRKEAKESICWLRLIETGPEPAVQAEQSELIREGTELMKILGAIFRKSE